MKTLKQFIKVNKITISSEYADENPNMENSAYDMYNYKVTLYNSRKRQMTLYFSMGKGHNDEPTVIDVLDCLKMDGYSFLNDESFTDFCGNFGYDEDSRKAHKTYLAVLKSGEKLNKFLGSDLFNELLDIEED
jgi:hypothetical protein